MAIFWLSISVIIVITVLLTLLPLRRADRVDQAALARDQQNVSIFKQRLAEIERDHDQGVISDQQFDSLKVELEQTVLLEVNDAALQQDQEATVDKRARWIGYVIAAVVPVMSLWLYADLGSSQGLASKQLIDNLQAHKDEMMQKMGKLQDKQQQEALFKEYQAEALDLTEQLVPKLEHSIAEQPDKLDNYMLLANSYASLGQHAEAGAVFGKVADKLPDTNRDKSRILGEQAQALYLANKNKMTTEITNIARQALALNPGEPSILGMMGIHSYESGEYAEAVRYWKALKQVIPPNSRESEAIDVGISKAQAQLAASPEGIASDAPAEAESKASLSVSVSLDSELMASADPSDVVFVLARPPGGRMPLAVKRMTVADLPAQIVLGDSDAMGPMMKLSSVQEAEVVARISKSGTPAPAAGDMEGVSQPVTVENKQTAVSLVINKLLQ